MKRTRGKTMPVRVRSIALPAEHGSWGLVIEPIALGLLVAPSLAGLCLGLGAFATFLTRRPFKVALSEREHGYSRRLTVAVSFVLLYAATVVVGFTATIPLAGLLPLLPILLGSPLVAVFLAYDITNQSRSWQAEFAGAIVFAMVAAGIALAGGWPVVPAFVLTGVLVARAIPSILYVRSRLRLDRNRPNYRRVTLAAHVAALAIVLTLVRAAWLSWLAGVPFFLLLARAVIGLSTHRRPMTIRTIGFTEMGYGTLTVAVLAVGYWL